MVAWQPVGIISGVYDIALRYCGERIQFDAPLTAYQITQVCVRGVGGVEGVASNRNFMMHTALPRGAGAA